METPEGWKTIRLEELFGKKDLVTLRAFINRNDPKGLREFLNQRESSLKEKGVLPDYLYYYLKYAFRDKLKEVV
jgi:hypothetical protein